MAKYPGRDGQIRISKAGAAVAAVLNMKSWTIDRKTDKFDVTCMGESNKTYVQGLGDAQGKFDALYDDTDDKLFSIASATGAAWAIFYPSVNAYSKYAYGQVWLDASIEVPVDGPVKVTGSFAAANSWTWQL